MKPCGTIIRLNGGWDEIGHYRHSRPHSHLRLCGLGALMRSARTLEIAAQKLYHDQTRAWSGIAWAWTKASEEVKERFRDHIRNGTRPLHPEDN